MIKTLIATVAAIASFALVIQPANAEPLPNRATVISQMQTVNDYWHANNDLGTASWQRGTYELGELAYYRTSHDSAAFTHADNWATANHYAINGGTTNRNADAQTAGQVYLDLYVLLHGKDKISSIASDLHHEAYSTGRDDWTWVDAVFMSMPALIHYGVLTNNQTYLRAAYQQYHYPKNSLGLLSPGKLFFRDVTAKNANQLWSRGNGWAVASMAETLTYLPHSNPLAAETIRDLRNAAARLKLYQRSDGFWPVDVKDKTSAAETSGTALDTYAIAYGIRSGVLDKATYLPVIERAWSALNTAVDASGRLGSVQGVARAPGPVDPAATADYGVGAYLLAGSEVAQLSN